MTKIGGLNYGGPSDETATIVAKINELIDAVNKLQELAQSAESSLAVDTKSIDSLSLQVSQHQEAIDDIELQISQLWNTGFSMIDNISSPNTITNTGNYMQCGDRIGKIHSRPMDTTTDTNVGAKIGNTDFSKISYSKEAVEQEAEDLMRESDAFRAGIQFAVEGFEKKEDEYISWQECVDERKKEMKSIYQD